jgi:hypothetical protein
MSLAPVPVLGFVPPPPVLVPGPVLNPAVGQPVPGLPVFPTPTPGLEFLEPFGLPPFVPPAFQPAGVPALPSPGAFPVDAVQPGPLVTPLIPPPFEGGQCDGLLYVGRYDYDTLNEPPQTFSVTFRARGPLSLGMGPIGSFQGVALRHRGAFPVQSGTTIPTCGQPFVPDLRDPTETVTVANSRNGRMVSLSGCGPDDCGNLPPEQEEVRLPNPARSFVPSPLFVPTPLPSLPPQPFPGLPPAPAESPDDEPVRVLPPPFPTVPPGELVPIAPTTIPGLPIFPTIPPGLVPPVVPTIPPRLVPPVVPPVVPGLVPPLVPVPPGTVPQFPALPPGLPTRQPVPPVVVVPPPVRIPPPVNLDCCALPEVIRQGNDIKRKLDEVLDDGPCVDLCEPAVMSQVVCAEDDNSGIITNVVPLPVFNLSQAVEQLSGQVASLAQYLNICAPRPSLGGGCEFPPGDIGIQGGAISTGVSGDASGVAEDGFVVTALQIEFLELPGFARPFRDGIYRGVGYFYFGVAAGLEQSYAGSMVKDGQLVLAPACNLTHWAVAANSGYNLLVKPYYRAVNV